MDCVASIFTCMDWYTFNYINCCFITNAINLIDGIDGLASGLSSVSLLVFGLLFINKGLWSYSMIAFSTVGVLVPFFIIMFLVVLNVIERYLWVIQVV